MDIEILSDNKKKLIKDDFLKGNTTTLCDEEFEISCIGTSVYTNCTTISPLDLDIVDSFHEEGLEKTLEEVRYLKNIVKTRLSQLTNKEEIKEMFASKFTEKRKERINIYVLNNVYLYDIYGDKRQISMDVLEELVLDFDKKANKKVAYDKIDELESKYGVKVKFL